MTPTILQIDSSTHIAAPRIAVFTHWLDPKARQRYETPEGSGMRYKSFSQQEGGVEEVEISHGGTVIGEMVQRLAVVEPPSLIISQLTGTFQGVTSLVMLVTLRFEDEDGGTGIYANSHVVDRSGREIKGEHQAGWTRLIENFTADFKTHGPHI